MNRAHSFSDKTGEVIVCGVEESKVQRGALAAHARHSLSPWQYCLRASRARERWQIYNQGQANQSINKRGAPGSKRR